MPKKMTQKEFIERCKSIHKNKYDYSKVIYNNNASKITIICPIHGEFTQTADSHLQGRECCKCANKYKPTNEEFIRACKIVHGDKYDYSKTVYKSNKSNVTITCKIHGDFSQIARVHLKGGECPLCRHKMLSAKMFLTTEQFVAKAREKHGDTYDYSLVKYKSCRTPVKIICKKHGVFSQVPLDHYSSGSGCPKCSRESKGEKKVREWLQKKDISFIPQKRFDNLKDIKYLFFDFYLPNQNILIEFNGEQHYKPNKFFHRGNRTLGKQQYHDLLKRNYAKAHKLKLITIPYTEFNNIEKILRNNTKKTNYTKYRIFTDENGLVYFEIKCKYEQEDKQKSCTQRAEKLLGKLLQKKHISATKI